MRNEKLGKEQKMAQVKVKLRKAMNCICLGELAKADEMIPSSESLATKDCSTSVYSSQAREAEMKPDAGNIEEEVRALLGRYEYQKGNIEATLHVFEGINIVTVTLKMKITLTRRGDHPRKQSQNYSSLPMSLHAVNLLLEAIFLKAKSLEVLGRYKGNTEQGC